MLHILAYLSISYAQAERECVFDREDMLALPQDVFDQDAEQGWRKLSLEGCDAAAAEIIADYRRLNSVNDYLLFWHEGQLRAEIGETEAAVRLFQLSRRAEVNILDKAWNLYADGSIAFLERDLSGLQAARDALSALERPNAVTVYGPNGQKATVPFPPEFEWPGNLRVLDALLGCFDRLYKQAYACTLARN